MEVSQQITRKSASNLALAFILLPRAKREGMAVLYAFCREVDDVADEETHSVAERSRRLEGWRRDIRRAFNGDPGLEHPVNREIQAMLPRYPGLQCALFEELLDGVAMDLEKRRYSTWGELDLYCYRVASVVGLLSIEIFGYGDSATRDYAVDLGKALQLTNILRDVHVDAGKDRIYLPAEEMKRHKVEAEEILGGRYSDRYARLAGAVADRAVGHYRRAAATLPAADRRNLIAAELMGTVYWGLLERLRARRFHVFTDEVTRLSKPVKLRLILRTWMRVRLGLNARNYG